MDGPLRNRKRIRICGTYAKIGHFMYSTSNDCHYISNKEIQKIIDGWTHWIRSFVDMGWDAYMVTVLFHQVAGSRKTKLLQMNQEVERTYNLLGTRIVRKPRSAKWAGYLPIGIFIPDLPVPKSRWGKKSKIADVSINDGLHMGGIIIANKWARVRTDLREHFIKEKDLYKQGKIRSIDVAPITDHLEDVVDYTFKSLKRRTSSLNDVLVLNWGGSGRRPDILRETMRKFLKQGRTS
jgi:hypothetical protein